MKFQDYYATLGLEPAADAAAIKRAYRKLARKYHPDVSRESDAEERFKEVAEAYEALKDPEKRAAYDQVRQRWQRHGGAEPPPDWNAGFEFGGRADGAGASVDPFAGFDHSDFFEALFGRHARGAARGGFQARGEDHHAKIQIEVEDAYQGAERQITLRVPELDARGQARLRERQVSVRIPKGIRAGQHLRLAGQGEAGAGGAAAGDLFLEVSFAPHRLYRVQERDVSLDLPVAPWEAALGAQVLVPTPGGGTVELRVPPGSAPGTRLRLKGKGLPGDPPGDFYAVLTLKLPDARSAAAQHAWRALGAAFPDFDPREDLHR